MNADLQYSFSLTTFSPSGKLGQISHALKAVQSAATAIGVRARDGFVLVSEKKIENPLVEPETIEKVCPVSETIGMTYSGLGVDFRVLVKKARKLAETYRVTYAEPEPVMVLVKELAEEVQRFTQTGGVRPFGCSLLVAGLSHDGHFELYQIDPSGSYYEWRATALGREFQSARGFLEKRWEEDMLLEDAIHTAILTLKESHDGVLAPGSCEVGVLGGEFGPKFTLLTREQIAESLAEVE